MPKFKAVVNKVNPYKIVRDFFGRPEDREATFSTPFGAVSLREWKEGVVVTRRVEYDPITERYKMFDEVFVPEEIPELIERLRKSKAEEVIE